MSDLVKTGSNLPTNQTDDPFQRYGEQSRRTSIVGKLLKFSKGDWTAGEHNDVVADGTRFVANMDQLLTGWVRWSDSKPTDHVMGRVVDGYQPPRRDTLGDLDEDMWDTFDDGRPRDPWQPTNYLLLEGTGKQKGELYTFTTSSRGGLNAIGDFCMKYGKVRRQRPNDYPIVEIGQSSYPHPNKNYGRIKYPVFTIVGWSPKSDFADFEGEAAAEEGAGQPDEIEAREEEQARKPEPAAPATQEKTPRTKLKARF